MSEQKNRGFVTIATGHRRYFNLARNLLHSYRQFTTTPYPFAIITDRENEITSEFDDVIVISDPSNSYLDKLKLYRELPYDESIFIDADSLAYGDLNAWWEIFETSGDFSLFGYAHAPNSGRGWFIPSGMQEFSSQITFVPDFNGGVYYLRKSDTCRKVFEIANHCATHYHRYQFTGFSSPADEPVLALGMAVQGLEPINRAELVFAPSLKKLEADISLPKAIYNGPYGQYTPRLIHWGNYYTRKSFYRFEVSKLSTLRNIPDCQTRLSYQILYKHRILYAFFHVYDISALLIRIFNKVKRILKNSSKAKRSIL